MERRETEREREGETEKRPRCDHFFELGCHHCSENTIELEERSLP